MGFESGIVLLFFVSLACSLRPISIHNRKFIDSVTNEEFKILGLHYQNHNTSNSFDRDSLSDAHACLRDATLFQRLGINTLHVSGLNASLSHDDCMSIFNYAGIYITVGLDGGDNMLSGNSPETLYREEFVQQALRVVDAFLGYENVLAFVALKDNSFVGDMVSFPIQQPFIRALIRDIRRYMARSDSNRSIPIGISSTYMSQYEQMPNISLIDTVLPFVECRISGASDDDSRIDFFGGQVWGANLVRVSNNGSATVPLNWPLLLDIFQTLSKTNIPVYLYAYRLVSQDPAADPALLRHPVDDFNLTLNMYRNEYTSFALSGGFALQWADTGSNGNAEYGIVSLGADDGLQLRPAYEKFAQAIKQLDTTSIRSGRTELSSTNVLPCQAVSPTTLSYVGSDHQTSSVIFNASWSLPAPFPTVSAWIASGVENGKRGLLTSITETVVRQMVRDVQGKLINSLSLTPFSSTTSPRSTSSSPLIPGPTAPGPDNGRKLRIGLGISLPLVSLAVLIIIVVQILRRKKKSRTTFPEFEKPELDGESVPARSGDVEELETGPDPQEMPGNACFRAELETVEIATKADGKDRLAQC